MTDISILTRVQRRLDEIGYTNYTMGPKSIHIRPPSDKGFSAYLNISSDGYTVAFDGWHEDFPNPEEALRCLEFGLSDSARLRVLRRGRCEYRWILESKQQESWFDDSKTGLLFFPIWRALQTEYRQCVLWTSTSGQI